MFTLKTEFDDRYDLWMSSILNDLPPLLGFLFLFVLLRPGYTSMQKFQHTLGNWRLITITWSWNFMKRGSGADNYSSDIKATSSPTITLVLGITASSSKYCFPVLWHGANEFVNDIA